MQKENSTIPNKQLVLLLQDKNLTNIKDILNLLMSILRLKYVKENVFCVKEILTGKIHH
jgi:hypothetical protein